MAGDALNDPNYAARLKLSEDPAKAKERAGLAGDYDVSGYSDKEISMALKGATFGDDDYARLTGKEVNTGEEDAAADPVDAPPIIEEEQSNVINLPIPDRSVVVPPAFGFGGGDLNIFQDNDQISTISGDNNSVVQNQDNSINGYSGNSSWKDAWMRDYFS